MDLDLRQNGTVLTGTARYYSPATKGGSGPFGKFGAAAETVRGNVDGRVQGDKFSIEINWSGTTGVYSGTIRPSGKIEGATYDKANPSKKVDWYSDTTMKCAAAGSTSNPTTEALKKLNALGGGPKPAATPTPVRTIKHTGHPAAPVDASNPAAPVGATHVPGITASPSVVTIPAGQTQGTTTLTWDAGSDHPYAEVWVQVDDQDETKIVEQGQGSRQVKVESGKTYLYSLSDSGNRLATVTVKAN